MRERKGSSAASTNQKDTAESPRQFARHDSISLGQHNGKKQVMILKRDDRALGV